LAADDVIRIHLQGMIASYIAAWTAFCLITLGPLLHRAWWLRAGTGNS
jgi:hypothetical protein